MLESGGDSRQPHPSVERAPAGDASHSEAEPSAALPADLHYVDDTAPGISRKIMRGSFVYFQPDGQRITDPTEIQRINKLVIPPAYLNVWICTDPCGHLQATGRDARGRKQYRYHPRWREYRDENKYDRLLQFGTALAKLRADLEKQLTLRGMPREKVMALVIQLLESTLIRIGNSRYARDNRSYGLTTLRNRHVAVRGAAIRFRFRGKSGVEHKVTLNNQRLARIMRRCMELPGQHLFQYQDERGDYHPVTSSDVNQFLQQVSGGDFTAKDYRTWAGSALALERLRTLEWQPESTGRANLVETVKDVARQLGNTPAVCRRCYIHPEILRAFADGELALLPRARKRKWLSREEVALLNFLASRHETVPSPQC